MGKLYLLYVLSNFQSACVVMAIAITIFGFVYFIMTESKSDYVKGLPYKVISLVLLFLFLSCVIPSKSMILRLYLIPVVRQEIKFDDLPDYVKMYMDYETRIFDLKNRN